jgi:hypothetical protein
LVLTSLKEWTKSKSCKLKKFACEHQRYQIQKRAFDLLAFDVLAFDLVIL